MRIRLTLFILALVILASVASAFPLTGGNGHVSATVFGATRTDSLDGTQAESNTKIVLDVAFNKTNTAYNYNVVLVDDDDKFYELQSQIHPRACGINGVSEENHRYLLDFSVPSNAVIKRLRIEPNDGTAPFSIEWNGIPQVSDDKMTIKFWSCTHITESVS